MGVLIVQGNVGSGVVGPRDGPAFGDVVDNCFAGMDLISPEVGRVAEAPRDGEVAQGVVREGESIPVAGGFVAQWVVTSCAVEGGSRSPLFVGRGGVFAQCFKVIVTGLSVGGDGPDV